MQRTLATVNINMGLGDQNPSLIITRSTNVPLMVAQFIKSYQLPHTAYDVIVGAIQKQLSKQNIDMQCLGRYSSEMQSKPPLICKKQMSGKQNFQKLQVRNRKQPISWDQLKTKKQLPINRIQFQKKNTSPVLPHKFKEREEIRRQDPKLTKITLLRTKSPIVKRDKSICETKRTISPIQNRTPHRQRQNTEHQKYYTNTIQKQKEREKQRQRMAEVQVLSKIFDLLTRNQPKTIRVLSPQYVSFSGIKPQILAILQNFFQQVQQHQFPNMDKLYFINKIRQLNLNKGLVQLFQLE